MKFLIDIIDTNNEPDILTQIIDNKKIMAKTKKKLKKWNGRASGMRGGWLYIAAYSKAEAARLHCMANGIDPDGLSTGRAYREISEYYSECWGDPMKGIEPAAPGVWQSKEWFGQTPERIV
jgi:hypothetical protein